MCPWGILDVYYYAWEKSLPQGGQTMHGVAPIPTIGADYSAATFHQVLSMAGVPRGTFEGKRVLESTAETALLRKVAGRWRIAHLHWSTHDVLLEEAKPNAK